MSSRSSHIGGRWSIRYQAKQDRLPSHTCKLFGRRCGRGGGETFVTDMNLERKAKKAERIGVGVAKRLALVQADILAKRGEAGDIHELDPLLEVEEARTRSVIRRLVGELAHQHHLLVRHNESLKCKACNVYRADRQFNFWSRTPCIPRPCAADAISRFRNKKRQNISADNSFRDLVAHFLQANFLSFLSPTM